MLNHSRQKWWFLSAFVLVCLIQIISASQHQLFGDEAFYWLESQNLDWSYAELPGWTQWMIALSQQWLPKSELTVRLPSLLAAASIPWVGMAISKITQPRNSSTWHTGLLLLALPMLMLAGILALPDIWIIFFGGLAVFFLMQGVKFPKRSWFFLLGLTLALGINVHVRFWMVIFIAATVTLVQYRTYRQIIKYLLLITMPTMLLGFIPIMLFNLHYDFPLLTFQFSDRHPWSFQPAHVSFFLIQIIITSPVMFVLFIMTTRHYKDMNIQQKTIMSIALAHWCLYAVLGFFSDDLRFNWHWSLLSYVLITIAVTPRKIGSALLGWSKLTGFFCSVGLMSWLYWALHLSQPISQLNERFTENARGWKELAYATQKQIKNTGIQYIITDQFMTLANLKFYLDGDQTITTLTHPLNQKHGRQLQLEIMGLEQSATKGKNLLVVEQTALKLEQTIPFYQMACKKLNGIKLRDTLDYQQGIKSFYFFETGVGICEIPPIIYATTENNQISGWVLHHKSKIWQLSVNENILTNNLEQIPIGSNLLFESLSNDDYQLTEFTFTNSSDIDNPLQIRLELGKQIINSARIN